MNAKNNLLEYFAKAVQEWEAKSDPFVWRLCLSQQFFEDAIELLNKAIAEEDSTIFLSDKEYAPIAMILLGEWYKRGYTGNNADNPEWIKSTAWDKVWRACGKKHWERWVYNFENSSARSWLYSGYVLGGLGCRYLSSKDRDCRLLRDFCRLFHGQIDESEIDASQNARAISMSIERSGSIYHFLLELMDPTSKINAAYDHDSQEAVRNLRRKIIETNREVTSRKLRTEWIFTTSPYEQENILRSLKIALGPERVEGEKRWFLSQERAKEWGFNLNRNITDIVVKLCLYKGNTRIQDPIDVLTFQPTGLSKAGFNNVNEDHSKMIMNLPADFDGWRLIAVANDGQEVDIDPHITKVEAYSQIFQTGANASKWSSDKRRMASAVVFIDNCRITDPAGHPVTRKLLLVDYTPTLHLNWADIPAYVVLNYPVNGSTRDVRLVSPLADCRIVIGNIYPDLIDYLPGGKIIVRKVDRASGGFIEEQMPFAFGLDHIKLVWLNDGKTPMTAEADAIIVRQNGEERDIDSLHKGIVEITAYGCGMEATAKVWYMPTHGKEVPGIRDFKKMKVRWNSIKDAIPATLADDSNEMAPTVTIEDRSIDGDCAFIEVYQPVLRTEIWFRRKLVSLLKRDAVANIALLNLTDVLIRVFDETGYRNWCGAEHIDDFKGLRFPTAQHNKTELPGIFVINFRNEMPPKNSAIEIGNYIFEADPEHRLWQAPRYTQLKSEADDDPFTDDYGDAPTVTPEEALEAAIRYNLYSFAFNELANKQSEIPALLSEIHDEKGNEFFQDNMEAVKRILWENDIKTTDLNFKI